MKEEWKSTEGYWPHVEVSNIGRIRTKTRVATSINGINQTRQGKIIAPYIGNHGYLVVQIKVRDERPKALVHRLVAQAFVSGYRAELSVNHIDGNKFNNVFTNLEWITLADNTRKQWETGLVDVRGEKHPSSKLSDHEALEIKSRFLAGEPPASIHKSYEHVSLSLVYKICQGKKKAFLSSS